MKVNIVLKPWGREVIWAKNGIYAGKILEIKKGQKLSLQFHKKKTETLYILEGKTILEIRETKTKVIRQVTLENSSSVDIEPTVIHRLVALEDSRILEVSSPELGDVVRLEDDYGRH
jgi:mannose-6-phosphate isomerase-like protein (cupin superfamily)